MSSAKSNPKFSFNAVDLEEGALDVGANAALDVRADTRMRDLRGAIVTRRYTEVQKSRRVEE